MKKILLFTIMFFAAFAANAQINVFKGEENVIKIVEDNVLYIIDGRLSNEEEYKKITSDQMKSFSVAKEVKKVFIVNTKNTNNVLHGTISPSQSPKSYNVKYQKAISPISLFAGMYILNSDKLIVVKGKDGIDRRYTPAMQITAKDVESLTIITDKDVLKKYNFKKFGNVSDGVIYIVLKNN